MLAEKIISFTLDENDRKHLSNVFTLLCTVEDEMEAYDIVTINNAEYDRDFIESARLLMNDLYQQGAKPFVVKGE